jgi:hypothetical protein
MAPYQLHSAYGPWRSKDNLNILKARLLLLDAAAGLAFKNSALYPRTVIASFVRLSPKPKERVVDECLSVHRR